MVPAAAAQQQQPAPATTADASIPSDSRAGSVRYTTMANQRKFFVGGNWKMNGDKAAIDGIISFMKGPLSPDTGEYI